MSSDYKENIITDCERNVSLIQEYLEALDGGEAGDSLRRFFFYVGRSADQIAKLTQSSWQESNLEQMLQRSLQGKQLLQRQSYEILSVIVQGDQVAVEARWSGILAVTVGTLAAGTEMKTSFAIFFRSRDGLIAMQKNYDCFDSW